MDSRDRRWYQSRIRQLEQRIAELEKRCNFKAQRMAKVMEWNEEKDQRIADLEELVARLDAGEKI